MNLWDWYPKTISKYFYIFHHIPVLDYNLLFKVLYLGLSRDGSSCGGPSVLGASTAFKKGIEMFWWMEGPQRMDLVLHYL